MRTTVTLDDALLNRAQLLSGVRERSALLKEALSALIERESARRLARLGGQRAKTAGRPPPQTRQPVMPVDSSIWIDHFRRGNAALAGLLETGLVCAHHFMIGESAYGKWRTRAKVLGLMQALRGCYPLLRKKLFDPLKSGN